MFDPFSYEAILVPTHNAERRVAARGRRRARPGRRYSHHIHYALGAGGEQCSQQEHQ